jgi:hypothetical protein
MTSRFTVHVATLTALTALAACADSPAGPRGAVDDQELLGMVLAMSSGAQTAGTTTCPGGGEILRSGTNNFSQEGDIVTHDFDTTLEFRSCRDLVGERTIVVDGQSRITGQIKSQLSAGEQGEMLEAAYRQTAAYRWRGEDASNGASSSRSARSSAPMC